MLFSIIVPVFNVEKYLNDCLESIRHQSFSDYEVIVVDDGSTDNCPSICDEYSRIDRRFKTIHKKNGGLVSARKTGALNVHGDYVLNVDADDFIDRDLLKQLSEEILSKKPDVIAFCYKTVCETGELNRTDMNSIEPRLYNEDVDLIRQSYMYNDAVRGQNGGCLIFSIWTKLVKREIYTKCQCVIDNRITKGEDAILNLYIIDKANSILVSMINGYNYRLQPESMTHVICERDIEKQIALVEGLRRFEDRNKKYKCQIDMYVFYSTYMILQRLVNDKTSYKQFRSFIHQISEAKIFENISSNLTNNVRPAEVIKVFLIKKKIWIMLYLYFKVHTITHRSRSFYI